MRIGIATDHGSFGLKGELVGRMSAAGQGAAVGQTIDLSADREHALALTSVSRETSVPEVPKVRNRALRTFGARRSHCVLWKSASRCDFSCQPRRPSRWRLSTTACCCSAGSRAIRAAAETEALAGRQSGVFRTHTSLRRQRREASFAEA